MLHILVTSLFMNSHFGLNAAVFLNASSSIAVVAGKPVELACDTGDDNDVQYWDHYSPMASNGAWRWNRIRIYNGIEIRPELNSNINWTQNSKGKWVLHIAWVNVSNSGLYKCERSVKGSDSLKTSNGTILELIVLASDPQCNISQDVFKEGEHIELWCSLEYFGSMAPVMEWTKDGIELDAEINSGTIYNVTSTEVMSKLYVKANSSLHNSKYACKFYFKQSSYEFKVPDYQYTWTSPILLVKYPPRYIEIIHAKKVFYPGETLNCSADGYPNPEFKWSNLEDRSSQIGSVLTVTKEMIRDTEYIYECIASNSENDSGIRRNITFTVNASFSILTATTISMGTLSILLLTAILVIRLKYIKDWITKITARFRRQANVEQGGEAEREANAVAPMVEEDPYGGYVGIREVAAYLEMRPDTERDHNEDNLAIGGIAESAEGAVDCGQIKSNGLHEREIRYSSYVGADGTEYMEMNGFRSPPRANPPTLPRITEPVIYARIDHTLQHTSPLFKKSTNFK